ncbi:MAG TPA: hypothetical protein VJN88_13770 [Ktedonobacterales bacterium]|nr:hypothetical protein [Ktedonobacterales bacterium]
MLRAVNLFQEQTPATTRRARRIVRRCQASLRSYSFDSLRWGGVVSELTDAAFTNDAHYLAGLRRRLESGHWELEKAYFKYDLTEYLSVDERRWYEALRALSSFLALFPHADIEAALHEYHRLVDDVKQAQAALTAVDAEDETLFQVVLTEVTAVLTDIHLDRSLRMYQYLTPAGAFYYKLVYPDDGPPNPPDAADSVAWARKTLDALAGDAPLYVTWQMKDHTFRLVLH